MGLFTQVFCGCFSRLSTKFRIRLWKHKNPLWRYRAFNLVNATLDAVASTFALIFVVSAKFKRCSESAIVSDEFCGFFSTYECSNSSYSFMLAVPMIESGLSGIRMLLRLVWLHLTSKIQNKVQLSLVDDAKLRKKIRRVMRIPTAISILTLIELVAFGGHGFVIALDKCRDRFTAEGQALVKSCRWHHLHCVQGFASYPTWEVRQEGFYYLRKDAPLDEPDRSWSYCNEKEYLYQMAQWWEFPSYMADDYNDPYQFLFDDSYDSWLYRQFECPDEASFVTPILPAGCLSPCPPVYDRQSNDPEQNLLSVWSVKFLDQTGRISYYRLFHQCYLLFLVYLLAIRLVLFYFIVRNTVPDALYAFVPPVEETGWEWFLRHLSPFGWNALGHTHLQ